MMTGKTQPQGKQCKLLLLSCIDITLCPRLVLPEPNHLSMTGGFGYLPQYNGDKRLVPCYSPIDIAVCGLQTVLTPPSEDVKNLNKWFIANPKRQSENYIYLGLIDDYTGSLEVMSVTQWRNSQPCNLGVLKKNAPFTFKG